MAKQLWKVNDNQGRSAVRDEDRLIDYCIARCGGGFTDSQTAAAMIMWRKARDTGKLGLTLTIAKVSI